MKILQHRYASLTSGLMALMVGATSTAAFAAGEAPAT